MSKPARKSLSGIMMRYLEGGQPADTIADYFNNARPRIFDDFPHEYFAEPLDDARKRTRDQVSMAFASLNGVMGDQKGVYLACAISSGVHGSMLAEQFRDKFHESGTRPTTVKMAEYIGTEYVTSQVFKPNTDKNLALIDTARQQFPDRIVIAPAGLEAFVHVISQHPGFSRRQSWQEDDYRAWWFPVIDHHIDTLVISSDLNYSRVGTEEIMRATLIQAGLCPDRPESDMRVVNLEGKPVSLFERAETIADYVRWAAPKGHDVGPAVTNFVRLAYLSDKIEAARTGEINVIDLQDIHPDLQDRQGREIQAMNDLAARMGPFINQYCADQVNTKDMPAPWLKRFLGGVPGIAPDQPTYDIKPFDDGILSVTHNTNFRARNRQTSGSRRYLLAGGYFDDDSKSSLFEDDLYGRQTSERERAILNFLMAASETAVPALVPDQVTLVVGDAKTSQAITSHPAAENIDILAELPGVLGAEYRQAALQARTDAKIVKLKAAAEIPGSVVVTSHDMRSVFDAVADMPDGVVAPGHALVGPAGRTAFRHKFIDRSVNHLVMMPGWAASPDNCQDMVRGTLIQLGLVPRQGRDDYDMLISDHTGKPMNLHDRIKAISDFVLPNLEKNIQVPEQSLALARMMEIHDLLVDPDYRRRKNISLSIQSMDPSLTGFLQDHSQVNALKALRSETLPILVKAAKDWDPSRLDGLHESYAFAAPIQEGLVKWRRRQEYGNDNIYRPGRPGR